MPHRERFRVNEVHSILDMLESDPDFLTANLYILPPDDPECSDEDSGDEDKGAPDNLSRRQVQAEAEVSVWRGNKHERLFSPDDNDDVTLPTPDPSAPQPTPPTSASASGSRRRRTAAVISTAGSSSASGSRSESLHPLDIQLDSCTTAKKRKLEKPVWKWTKADMPGICRPSGTVQHTQYSSTDLTPTALFEKIFDDEVMQLLTDNTNKYALQKGKHGFVTCHVPNGATSFHSHSVQQWISAITSSPTLLGTIT